MNDPKELVQYEELDGDEVVAKGMCPRYIVDHMRSLGKTIRIIGEDDVDE